MKHDDLDRVNVFLPYSIETDKQIVIWMSDRDCSNFITTTRNRRSPPKGLELWLMVPPEHVLDFLLTFGGRLSLPKNQMAWAEVERIKTSNPKILDF
jgi:hypothetical protein